MKFVLSILIIFSLSLGMGCNQKNKDSVKEPINSFGMQINGQLWKPYQDPNNICRSTYAASYRELVTSMVIPIYTIDAYRDPNGTSDAYSDNSFRLQIQNVKSAGSYLLDGTYKEDFDSYAIFLIKSGNNLYKRYINLPERSAFIINVESINPIKGMSIAKGLEGNFSGVLYNEVDHSDSLRIEKGQFVFNLVNVGTDHQCGL